METHIIELRGWDTPIFKEYGYTAKGGADHPVPSLVRCLIDDRVIGRNDMAVVKRSATVCFNPCRARAWARIDVVELDRDGLVRRRGYIRTAASDANRSRKAPGALKGPAWDVPGPMWPEDSTTGD